MSCCHLAGAAMGSETIIGGCVALFCLGFGIFIIVLLSSIKVVEVHQQLLFRRNDGNIVKNGPFTQVVWPHERMERREASRIGEREYAVIKDMRMQTLRHHVTPGLVFLGPYEVLEKVETKMSLQKKEYIRLVDRMTGAERIVSGPTILVPEPLEDSPKGIEQSLVVGATNAILVENKTSGMKSLITTKGMFVPAAYQHIIRQTQATLLEPKEYALVKDTLTGKLRNEEGPQLLHVQPYERLLNVTQRIVLEKDEYIRYIDQRDGTERVVIGPSTVVPDPQEESDEGKTKAVFLTLETAVVVLNKTSGQRRLITQTGVFIPGPYERVVQVVSKIRVLPSEAVVVRDTHGNLTVQVAGSTTISFFLEPFTQLVQFSWSRYSSPNLTEPVPKETFTKIDMRVRKMFVSTQARTMDNVKLRLEATIFWSVQDVDKMTRATSDPAGDVAQRTRSSLIQVVSSATLAVFMKDFTNITSQASVKAQTESFYTDRGVNLQSLEVTKFECVEAELNQILQQIIEETTNRINALAKAKSENDIKAAKLEADILLEQQRTALLNTQASNARLKAETEGRAAGEEILEEANTFIGGLNDTIPDVSTRVKLYQMHESMDSRNLDTRQLANGKAQLFLTPNELNLKLAMPAAGPEL